MAQQRKRIGSRLAAGGLLAMALAAAMAARFVATAAAADPAPATTAAASGPDRAADEKAIRATADDFVKAFNAANAKAVGALWAPDAEYTDVSGQSYRGRTAIEKEYAATFTEHPRGAMTVNIDSIRFFGPDVAVEKGVARLTSPAGETSAARYTVVHARRDGTWTMVDCRDAPFTPAANENPLKDLEWLIGDWTAGGKDESRQIKFEWMCDRNFIKASHSLTKDGKTKLGGGQIIGWNPKLGQIVSLHFDANGGFGNDVWIKDGSNWVIEASGVFRDGSESTAVNILTPIDAKSFTWQSVKRTIDGVRLPDMPPVKVVKVQPGQ